MELIIALTLIAAVITVVFVAIQIRQSDEKSDETETHHAEAQSSRTSMEGTSARTADATEKIADLLAEAPLPPGGTELSEDDRQLLAALTAAESPTESADSATGYGGDTFFYLSLAEAQFIRHPQLGRDLPVSDSQMRSLIDSGAISVVEWDDKMRSFTFRLTRLAHSEVASTTEDRNEGISRPPGRLKPFTVRYSDSIVEVLYDPQATIPVHGVELSLEQEAEIVPRGVPTGKPVMWPGETLRVLIAPSLATPNQLEYVVRYWNEAGDAELAQQGTIELI